MWGEGREMVEMEGGRGGGRGGKGEKRKRRAWLELKPSQEVRLAAGEAQKGASREVQAAMRARFSCS